jgi:hypothetical protein
MYSRRAIKMQADTFPEMDDPFEIPQRDPSANPEVILQDEPTTELTEEQDELPMSTGRTTRSGREVRTPQRL